jgi:hypothetical protein
MGCLSNQSALADCAHAAATSAAAAAAAAAHELPAMKRSLFDQKL